MQVPQFNEAIKGLDHIQATKLAQLTPVIKQSLQIYKNELGKVGHAICKLAQTIMKIKDVKSECVEYFEDLICQIIKISIGLQFRVGFDAMRFVFNPSSEFYKTSNIDMSLNYPLGKDRPLEQYNPMEGEDCDTVKPYITSTSFCGWTRCTVLQVNNQKYTIKYANYNNPNTVRQKPWFAPYGSRTRDYQWRLNLNIGSPIDALLNRVWYKSTIAEVGQQNGTKKVRVTYRRFNPAGDRQDSQGNKYFGLSINQDQWIDVLSPRIQQDGKMSDIKLCHYTFNSEQIILDDSYDICFQKQYKQKPFYAIMRVVTCRSLSMMKFINTFVQFGGVQKVLQLMRVPDFNDQIIYFMLANIGGMVQFFPRMFIKQQIFKQIYQKIADYFYLTAKNLNPYKIDMGYYCYDQLGRRLFSLTQVYEDQSQLRKVLIRQFLKMNMQKQMLALRYLGDLINPKKPYTQQGRQNLNKFLRNEKIFPQIFNSNTHEQIISRSGTLLQYLIRKQIISEKQFENLWRIVPSSDVRGRAIIQKLLTDLSKNIPLPYVEFLVQKILLLKQSQLTMDNLNLLKQLKNRSIKKQLQMKILSFLWDLLTVKSSNLKANIEQQVQKIFKTLMSTIKDPTVRMSLLQSMSQKLQQSKKIKNQIQILKDFINTYPQKIQTEMIEQKNLDKNIPLTVYQAVQFLKSKGIYSQLLKLLSKAKEQNIKKDLLQLFTFLFNYDFGSINQIIEFIYERLGPSVNFLQWIHKLMDRSLSFAVDMLEKTTNFTPFESLSKKGFEFLNNIIVDVNSAKKNLKVVKQYHYSQKSTQIGPLTKQQATGQAKKQTKLYSSYTPQINTNFTVLIPPFHIIGLKFLQNMLLVLKQTTVYNATVKLIIQFFLNLDESIQSKTQQFRKQFLQELIKQIQKISIQNAFNQQVKIKLQTYISIILQIFGETEKQGLGDLKPHFQNQQGQKINLMIQNLYQNKEKKKQNNLEKFNIVCSQNITLWRFKKIISEIICQPVQNIDVHKYSDPMDEVNNGKSLTQLVFYDNQSIKIKKKQIKSTIKSKLLNEDGSDVSQKLQKIIHTLFEQYKNKQTNGLSMKQMQKLAEQRWSGSLFKQKQRLQKMYEQHDKQKKGFLSFTDLKQFFYKNSTKNQNAIWRLINLSGFKNDLSLPSEDQKMIKKQINTNALPRKILSQQKVYKIIFSVLENQTFKQVHLNFYKLLSKLEVNTILSNNIEQKIYTVITNEKSAFALCYATQILNAKLAVHTQFYYNFWQKGGVSIILNKIKQIVALAPSVYALDQITKNMVLPGLVKTINLYVSQLLAQSTVVRYIRCNKINHMSPKDFVNKIENQLKNSQALQNVNKVKNKLLQIRQGDQQLKQMFTEVNKLFQNLIFNYNSQKSEYLQKLTIQIVRLLGCLISCGSQANLFVPQQHIIAVRSTSLNFRRSIIIFIYIHFFYSSSRDTTQLQQLIIKIIQQLPTDNKFDYQQYFMLLNQLISRYLTLHQNDSQKDQFFIKQANHLLNTLFTSVIAQQRTQFISNRIILGILTTIENTLKKESICRSLSSRMPQIMQKCLFAYKVQQKLNQLIITQEMLKDNKQNQQIQNYVICKTQGCRDTAYKIVSRIYQVTHKQYPDFIDKWILPILKDINPQVRLTSSRGMAVGLKNFGSTCYMNSMLQVLNTVQPFRNSIMKANSEHPVVKQLKNLFAALFFSQRMDYAPLNLLNAFVPPINPMIQQDTTQFLNFLFDQLQSGLSNTKYKKLLQQIFKGANASQMICHSCGYKKQNRQQFFSFGVQIQGKSDLQSALQGSYQGQIISGYLCDQCQNKGQTTKRNILSQIPNIMFIHLRRIVFNYDMFVNMKIHTRLQFPQQLNIQPYTKQGVQLRERLGLQYMKNLSHNEQEMKKFQIQALHNKHIDFYKLKLKAIIVHSGSADVGHYYSILMNSKMWRKYDDSRISVFTHSDFQNQCYGGTFISEQWGSGTSRNAYVLVYQKVIKHPIQIQMQNTDQKQQVKYQDFNTYNSPEDYRNFWLDNHNFMVQTQLLDPNASKPFINFICNLLKNSPTHPNKAQIISEVIYKVSFYSNYIGDLLKLIYDNASSVTPDVFHTYLVKNKQRTFKLLLSFERNIREFMAAYIHIVLLQTYKNGDQALKQQVIAYIEELLGAMTGEVAKNWMRVDGYFKLIFFLVSNSISFIELYKYFLSKNLISTLIDFVMEKQSPVKISTKNYSLGTKSVPMDFNFGIATIMFLLRHSYGFTGKNYQSTKIPEQFLFHLSKNDTICLSHMQFYRKLLQTRQNMSDVAGIIHRLCIQNLQFSKAISQVVLESICSVTDSKDQMVDYSKICLQIMRIKDGLWIDRAQALLGIGLPYIANLNLMTAIDDQRYSFVSTIYDVFPVQCLFNYVYLYRLKNTLACYNIITSILQGCSVCDEGIKFIARQPSPNYLFPNYLCWIQNFLSTLTQLVSLDAKNKSLLQAEILNTMKYLDDVKKYMQDNKNQLYYHSVITGLIENKKVVQSLDIDGIQVKVYEYQAYCYESIPLQNGGNLAMQQYLQGSKLKNHVSDKSNILKFFKKPGKSITLKLGPIQQPEDKQLTDLFDDYPNIQTKMINESQKQPKPIDKIDEVKQKTQIQAQQVQMNLQGVYKNNYFRQIQVVNMSKQKKYVSIQLKSNQNSNFLIPKYFSWKIGSKSNESLWIAKQNPLQDWNQIQIKCHVQDYIKQKHEKKSITSWWFKSYQNMQIQQIKVQINPSSNEVMQNENESKTQTVKQKPQQFVNQHPDQIQCPQCTVFNHISNTKCQVCDGDLY